MLEFCTNFPKSFLSDSPFSVKTEAVLTEPKKERIISVDFEDS